MSRATDDRGHVQPMERDPDRRNAVISHALPSKSRSTKLSCSGFVVRALARCATEERAEARTTNKAPAEARPRNEYHQHPKVPGWLSGPLILGAFGLLVWLERRRPLRRPVEPKSRRDGRNLAIAAIAAATVQLAEKPVTDRLTALVERRRWGLLKQFTLPAWLEVPLAAVLLDYTLYLWHILTHRVPLLWRFHQPHHVDLDLDASTALRFHFGELALSVAWRAGQVVVIGVSPLALSVWQTAVLVEIMFHHSNVDLPIEVERWLSRVVVTPRLHGIHHSIVPEEANSNWSSGLTAWDWLHGTLKLNVPQDEVTIGVPAYRAPEEVTLPRVLEMPFAPQRPSWQIPGDGVPARRSLPAPADQLAP